MRRLTVIFALLAVFASALPASAGVEGVSSSAGLVQVPSVAVEIVRNGDFFARRSALRGFEECSVSDVKRLNRERIGVCLISPSGFESRIVYDVPTMRVVYRETLLPERERRDAMRRASVSVPDAIALAVRAAERVKGGVR